MKASTKTSILLKAFDLELKALLQQDIKAFKQNKLKQSGNNQGTGKELQAA